MNHKGWTKQCANKACNASFKTSPRYPKDFCGKCAAQEATVYVPRYNGINSKVENPDADDDD